MLNPMVGALRIGIFAPEPMQRRLQAATNRPVSILSTLTELERFARESSVGILFVDPMFVPNEYRRDTMQRLCGWRQTYVILYVRMTSELAPVLLEIGRMGVRQVVFFNADDDVTRLKALLAYAVTRFFPPSRSP